MTPHTEVGDHAREGSALAPDAIKASEWLPGVRPRPIDLADAGMAEGVLYFEVASDAEVAAVYHALSPLCGEDLSSEMVGDLLQPDELPKVRDYGQEGRVRKVSAFAVVARDPEKSAQTATKSGTLVFELAEFLAGERWIISCWHRAHAYAGAHVAEDAGSQGHEAIFRGVEKRWLAGEFQSAGDLGVLLLHEMTCSYSKARWQLVAWFEQWELSFYADATGVDPETLVRLRG